MGIFYLGEIIMMAALGKSSGHKFHDNGKEITYETILNLAELLQYISVKVQDKVSVLIDNKAIEIEKERFVKEVYSELDTGKTLVSAIRSTVFNRIRSFA